MDQRLERPGEVAPEIRVDRFALMEGPAMRRPLLPLHQRPPGPRRLAVRGEPKPQADRLDLFGVGGCL